MPHSNCHPWALGPDLVHLEKSWTRAAGGCVNFRGSSGHQKQRISRVPCTHVVKFWMPSSLIPSLSTEHDVGMYNNVLHIYIYIYMYVNVCIYRWNDASSTIPPSSELSEASEEGGATSLGIAASMESPAFEASWVPESVVPNPPGFWVATSARTNERVCLLWGWIFWRGRSYAPLNKWHKTSKRWLASMSNFWFTSISNQNSLLAEDSKGECNHKLLNCASSHTTKVVVKSGTSEKKL